MGEDRRNYAGSKEAVGSDRAPLRDGICGNHPRLAHGIYRSWFEYGREGNVSSECGEGTG